MHEAPIIVGSGERQVYGLNIICGEAVFVFQTYDFGVIMEQPYHWA